MNTLIVIGHLGNHYCYLNVTREAAIASYLSVYPEDSADELNISEITFDDVFGAYEVWSL